MDTNLRVLMITSEWPTAEHPDRAPFIAQHAKHLRMAGVDIDVFPFRGGKNPANYMRAWYRVQRRLGSEERSYDLVHAHFGQSAVLSIPKRIPLVVTFRGSDVEGIVGNNGHYTVAGHVLRTLSRFVALLADEIIVVSESLGKWLPKRCKYQVIPSGVDLDLFSPRPKAVARATLGLPADRRLVLFGGNPSDKRKRHGLAQEAVALLQQRSDVRLVVASGVPHHVMPVYMNACDVLLLTSLHEGSPNVVKEALACNLPVVSVDVGDVRERVGDVPACVLCEDDRPETIAAGLAAVLGRREPTRGREAITDLDERVLARRVVDVYRRAIRRFSRGTSGECRTVASWDGDVSGRGDSRAR